MKFLSVILTCLIGLGSSNVLTGIISPLLYKTEVCTGERLSTTDNVICVSKTQFVMSFQDAEEDTPLSCPAGTFCVAGNDVCSATGTPVCLNDTPGATGVCNTCDTGTALYSPVCISKTQYAICSNGKFVPNMIYTCPPATSFCKAIGPPNQVTSICTASNKNLDCAK